MKLDVEIHLPRARELFERKRERKKDHFTEARPLLMKALLHILIAICFFLPGLSAAKDITLRFVTWKPEASEVWDQIIKDFERENPGVKIIREVGPHSSTQFHDLVTQKLKNQDPEMDVFFMDVIWPAEFASAGWALPLERFFPRAEREEFLQAPIHANTYRDQIFGVPVFIDAGLLYFRRDLLQKNGFAAPQTWPELVRQAKVILEREGDPPLTGFSGQFKQYEGLICNIMEYILSNGGAFWDEERLRSALNQPPAKQAVEFVRDHMIREISHRGVLAYEEPESLNVFIQGKAVFHRNWPYAWKIANDPAQSKVAGKVGMTLLPAFPGGKSVATLGGWQLGISRFSRKSETAWKFVSFMTSAKIQKRITLSTGRAPTRKLLYQDHDVLRENPHFRDLLGTFIHAVPRPRTPVYVPLSNIMQRYFSSAIALPDSDIDRLASSAARDMDRVLDLLRQREAP